MEDSDQAMAQSEVNLLTLCDQRIALPVRPAPRQWVRLTRNGASWALSTGSAFKAREIDGIGNGIEQVGNAESGVNTTDGACY